MASLPLINKKRLKDQYIQDWLSTVFDSSKCILHRAYKHKFELEQYLCMLSPYLRKNVCRFRTSNHKLTIETGSYNNVTAKIDCVHFVTPTNFVTNSPDIRMFITKKYT